MVATPIGNLADISLRSLHVLQMVDAIACEDTRHTQGMLRSYGLERPGHQLLAVHQHNEAEAAAGIIARLQQGQRIAYVSDAGTPGVSDPAHACARPWPQQACAPCRCPVPAASPVPSAWRAVCRPAHRWRLCVCGFLAHQERRAPSCRAQAGCGAALHRAAGGTPPHPGNGQSLGRAGCAQVTLAREITKQFEQITTRAAVDVAAWLDAEANRSKGEFVVVLHPVEVQQENGEAERVLRLLLAELPTKTAVKLTAEITGGNRNTLYDRALEIKREGEDA